MNIPVAYEDNWLLVVNKPSGLLVIPTPKNERRTLTNILNEDLKCKGQTFHLYPCHRLDRETSGLIIYAKGKSIQKKMMDEFKARRVRKTYTAFVHGHLPQPSGTIDVPIEHRKSTTQYQVREIKKLFTMVSVHPITGRTNQIRIHFKKIGHPLVGESKYAFRRDYALKAKRVCLHAVTLEFIHPVTGKRISLHSELPQDMQDFLKLHNHNL